MKWMRTAFLAIGVAALGSVAAMAQAEAAGSLARTDVSASLYGAFTGTTSGNGTLQSPSNQAGGLLEIRHIMNPLVGFEGTYAYNRADQSYTAIATCGLNCTLTAPVTVASNAHEVTGDWIASLKIASFRPFVLAGGGLLLSVPAGGQLTTSSVTKGVFVYGAGTDWEFLPHLGLRLQYRGNLYQAPALSTVYNSTGSLVHTAEPMIGVFLRL
jgi:opacity protein-like surface antigen